MAVDAVARKSALRPPAPAPSPYRGLPVADHTEMVELLNAVDPFAGVREALREVGERDNSWAGIPMPLEDLPLTVEPNFPRGEGLMEIGRKEKTSTDDEEIKIINVFWSWRWRADIVVYEVIATGKRKHTKIPAVHGMDYMLATIGASFAWGIEQEAAAVQLLGTLIEHHKFKQYLLTGMFMENSERSGLTYVFRRLRPTIALSLDHEKDEMRILCALCLHPIAYYEDSWAGAMCPTDDVIAHLMLMRGDEPMFWRRANQHPPYRPEAGL